VTFRSPPTGEIAPFGQRVQPATDASSSHACLLPSGHSSPGISHQGTRRRQHGCHRKVFPFISIDYTVTVDTDYSCNSLRIDISCCNIKRKKEKEKGDICILDKMKYFIYFSFKFFFCFYRIKYRLDKSKKTKKKRN